MASRPEASVEGTDSAEEAVEVFGELNCCCVYHGIYLVLAMSVQKTESLPILIL